MYVEFCGQSFLSLFFFLWECEQWQVSLLVFHQGKQMEFGERFKMEVTFQFGAENAYARLGRVMGNLRKTYLLLIFQY